MKEFLRSFLCFWPCCDNDNTAYFEHMRIADDLRDTGKLKEALEEYQLATTSYRMQPEDSPSGKLRSETACKAIRLQLFPPRGSVFNPNTSVKAIAERKKEWEMREHWKEEARQARERDYQDGQAVSNFLRKVARDYGS